MTGRSHRHYADISQHDGSSESETEMYEINPISPPEEPSESRRHRHHRREREREGRGEREASPAAPDRVDSELLHHQTSRSRRRRREAEDPSYRAANRDFQRRYGGHGGGFSYRLQLRCEGGSAEK